MILAPLLVPAISSGIALPKRPSYVFRTGERVAYAWRSESLGKIRTATVNVEVVRAGRDGRADLRFVVAEPTQGAARPPSCETISVDRWLERTERGDHPATVFDVLRLERPGARKDGTYSLVPGEGGVSVYEVSETRAATNPALVATWRRTVVLASDGGWPLSGETRSTFADGSVIASSLVRLER